MSAAGKPADVPAGTVLSTDGGRLTVACGTGALEILGVLPEGKGRMPAAAFLNGRGVKAGDRLGEKD